MVRFATINRIDAIQQQTEMCVSIPKSVSHLGDRLKWYDRKGLNKEDKMDYTYSGQQAPIGIKIDLNTVINLSAIGILDELLLSNGLTASDLTLSSPLPMDTETLTSDSFTLIGSAFDDTLVSIDGEDLLVGGNGNDYLEAGGDRDTLFGGVGDDTLFGGNGKDYLIGDAGADLIDGGADADEVFGGDGNDTLIGGRGFDTLTGGQGSDLFILSKQNTDSITDFTQEDILGFSAAAFGNQVPIGQTPILGDAIGATGQTGEYIIIDSLSNIQGISSSNTFFAFDTSSNQILFNKDNNWATQNTVIASVANPPPFSPQNFVFI